MNLLLDTHAVIWWLDDSNRLGRRARKALANPENNAWISAVSVWEISIKMSVGRLKFRGTPEAGIASMLDQGFRSLPVVFAHAFAVRNLPLHHNDPFDRLLIAQAQCEDFTLMTTDPWMRAYNVRTIDASL